MHREPEVPEAEAQVGKWLDCRARITSKELAPLHYSDYMGVICRDDTRREVAFCLSVADALDDEY